MMTCLLISFLNFLYKKKIHTHRVVFCSGIFLESFTEIVGLLQVTSPLLSFMPDHLPFTSLVYVRTRRFAFIFVITRNVVCEERFIELPMDAFKRVTLQWLNSTPVLFVCGNTCPGRIVLFFGFFYDRR